MKIIRIENEFIEVELLSLGAKLLSFKHKQDMKNIVVRYHDIEAYRNDTGPYLGACIGPIAGRVAGGHYGDYQLSLNAGENHLHGGEKGIHGAEFESEVFADKVIFKADVDHREDGYPGKVNYTITFALEDESLVLTMDAIPEHEQFLNLTNHAYFNLDGSETLADHKLKIDSSRFGKFDASLAYKGELLDVKGSILDFSAGRVLRETITGQHPQFAFTRNLDHMIYASELTLSTDSKSLNITTDAPGFQVYAANYFDGNFKDEYGRDAQNHAGLAIEPQRPGNEVNFNPNYPVYSHKNPFHMQSIYTLKLIP